MGHDRRQICCQELLTEVRVVMMAQSMASFINIDQHEDEASIVVFRQAVSG